MGVLHGRDLFSSKYITAEIKDSSKRLHFVPIKYTIGDYFLADIDGQVFCFKIDDEICQYREKLTKQFQVIQYSTKHYRPIKDEIKELELVLKKNGLPKVNGPLSEVFRFLSLKEKSQKEFEPHDLKELIEGLGKKSLLDSIIPQQREFATQQKASIINFLDGLDIENIVTPVRNVSNYIEDDLKATDPKFLGTIASTLENVDFENKRVTNYPIKSKQAWMKFVAIFSIIGIILAVGYIAYDAGAFDDILKLGTGLDSIQFPSIGGPPPSQNSFLQKYPTPEAAKAALDRGEITESQIPASMRELVKNVETPKVEKKIELGG